MKEKEEEEEETQFLGAIKVGRQWRKRRNEQCCVSNDQREEAEGTKFCELNYASTTSS
jgi:hypothetical protein